MANRIVYALGLTGLLLAGRTAFAQETLAFSVKEAVDYAGKNSLQVKNALLDIKIQEQTNRDITSAAFPQLSGTINVNDYIDLPVSLVPGEFFGQPAGTFAEIKFGTKYSATLGLSLKQLLFDGQVFVGLQARDASIALAQKNVEITEENIKANIYKIYYQLVVGKTQMSTIDANISRTSELLKDTKVIYQNGFAEKLDVDKLEVTLANLNTEKIKLQNQLDAGMLALKLLMGMPARQELVLTDTLSDSQLKDGLLEGSYSYKDRKDYQQLEILAELGKYNIKRYKMSYIPTVSLTGNYNKNAQRNSFDFFKSGQPWFTTTLIGLSIDVPIFDGFGRAARVQKARYELQQTQNNMELLKMSIDNDVENARLKTRNAIVSMDFQHRNMELAESVYNQTKKKYEQGLGSNIEITNAQTELKTAQNNYYSALYDAIIARIDYLKAIGKL